MQRNANCTFRHGQPGRCFPDRRTINSNCLKHVTLALRQRPKMHLGLPQRCLLLLRLCCEPVRKIVNIDERSSPALAQGIDQLVPGNSKQPRTNGRARIPCMPLQVHCQQDLLHDILTLISRLASLRQPALRRGAQNRCDRNEQAMIGSAVAASGRAHQIGPLVAALVGHVYREIRSSHRFVTPTRPQKANKAPQIMQLFAWQKFEELEVKGNCPHFA